MSHFDFELSHFLSHALLVFGGERFHVYGPSFDLVVALVIVVAALVRSTHAVDLNIPVLTKTHPFGSDLFANPLARAALRRFLSRRQS
jgi:hypothetical protein